MTESTSTALVPAVPPSRAARLLDRVAALTPEEWGRLEAIGQRESARDLVGRLWRADAAGQTVGELAADAGAPRPLAVVLDALVTGTAFYAELGAELADALVAALRGERARRTPLPLVPHALATSDDPGAQRMTLDVTRLRGLAATQPGGAEGALACLVAAVVMLDVADLAAERRPGAAIAGVEAAARRWYAPVEPVIPYASL